MMRATTASRRQCDQLPLRQPPATTRRRHHSSSRALLLPIQQVRLVSAIAHRRLRQRRYAAAPAKRRWIRHWRHSRRDARCKSVSPATRRSEPTSSNGPADRHASRLSPGLRSRPPADRRGGHGGSSDHGPSNPAHASYSLSSQLSDRCALDRRGTPRL